MKIKITRTGSGLAFPYGSTCKEDAQFVTDNVGNVFDGERECMNYYKLSNGHRVHIYNGYEKSEAHSNPKLYTADQLREAQVKVLREAADALAKAPTDYPPYWLRRMADELEKQTWL